MNISFNWKEVFDRYRYPILILLSGLILLAIGIIFWKNGSLGSSTKVEVLSGATTSPDTLELTVEIAGSVVRPGVYKMPSGSRIDDLLILSGGFSGDADRTWTEKYLNRAGVLTDGQKIYIPHSGEISAKSGGGDQTVSGVFSSDSNGLININTASLKDLIDLPEIARARAQSIVDHRYYSNIEELVSKGVLTKNIYDKIKDKITIY